MAKKLALGLIGTGVAARLLYLPAFQKLSRQIELVACANRGQKKAEDFARLARIPRVVDTAEQLIALPEVEAVLISLPIDAQPRYVVAALKAGKAVLSEKPVAPSVAAGRRLLKQVHPFRARAPWLVGENFAFMPHVRRLEQWLRTRRLGKVHLIEARQITTMDSKNPFFSTPWRHEQNFVGGFVVDSGVHLADVVRRCFGMPVVVKNVTAHSSPSLPPPDTAAALLKFQSGLVGTWTSCFNARYDGPMLRVYGSKADAELRWHDLRLRDAKGHETVFIGKPDSFEVQFRHFVDVVKNGTRVAITPEEALDDLALMEAIVQ